MAGGLSSADIFVDKGEGEIFSCRRPHFLVHNTSHFSKFMVCPHGQGVGVVEPVGTFCEQGRLGQFFTIMCGRLLWTAPYQSCSVRIDNALCFDYLHLSF